MVKYSYSLEHDQYDSKVFRESLGTFGTTTVPGSDQLQSLQAKVRQGVKHVELHLSSAGKGQFNALDTPDKYGFEQRRTIMQLAKLNQQSLSVHSDFSLSSFSGITQNGFNEAERWKVMKEIDETIKFAAETAKQGAIVMHIHEQNLPSAPGDISLPRHYIEWLKKNKPQEYERLDKTYFSSKNSLQKDFVDNPEMNDYNIKNSYQNLSQDIKENFEKTHAKKIEEGRKVGKKVWDVYYEEQKLDKLKLAPDMTPLIVVGDKIDKVERQQEIIDIDVLNNYTKKLNNDDINILKKIGINVEGFSVDDFQRANSIFTNGLSQEYEKLGIDENKFNQLKDKLILKYDNYLSKNYNMTSLADKEFADKLNKTNQCFLELQKNKLETKYKMFQDELERIKKLETENRDAFSRLEKIDDSTLEGRASRDAIKMHISQKNQEIQHLRINSIGQEDYHLLSQYDESIAQINKQLNELKKRDHNVKSLTEEVFNKNKSSIAHFGAKALSYQLELKEKSKSSQKIVEEINLDISNLEKQYTKASKQDNFEEMQKINTQLSKRRSDLRKHIGLKDYQDIDVKNKPLYISPENMIVGYGYMTNLEEYKALIRESWNDFAHKITSDDDFYKSIREKYEKETGEKINEKNAYEIAKKHIGGTFDNAHAGVWLKYFKKNKGESEEGRIERFNKWLNTQAEEMAKEGIIKHIHMNDSLGKDDDHNLLGTGVLDIHDLKHRLRKAGIKEPMIVEAGGRGSNTNLHLTNAFETFNASLNPKIGYSMSTHSGVSDWISVKRDYQNRPQYSQYGMSDSTFRHVPPQQGQERGDWSGTSFF